MAITPLPPMPSRSDTPANFITKSDAFLASLNIFATQVDAVGVAIVLTATNSNSVTSATIGLGSKTLIVPAGKSYLVGMTIKVASTATGSDWMLGDVTSYSGTALIFTVNTLRGSGTFADWSISQSAPGGAQPGANTDITSLASPNIASATATTQATTDRSVKVATTAFVGTFIPAGTRMPFYQASPPLGWDLVAIQNDSMMRVVSAGTSGGNAYANGGHSPILNNVVASHTHTFTGDAMPAHSHTDTGHAHGVVMGAAGAGMAYPAISVMGSSGGAAGSQMLTQAAAANIDLSSAGTPTGTVGANAATNWQPRYMDFCIGQKS